jgi:hypothetical protein
VITAVVAASFTANAAGGKVKIKHKGKVIEVSSNALGSHLDHGDVQLFLFRGSLLSQAEINAILASELSSIEQEFVDNPRDDYEFDEEEPPSEPEF